MSSKIFLQTLQSKLKGGNARSIHLNALPGRLATRFDFKQLDTIKDGLATLFLNTLLTKPNFEFKVSFDELDLNEVSSDNQKKLATIAKRLNSIAVENDDYYKEHGVKTLGFGYPILIKRSSKDPKKIIKAPLFIWPLEAIKSKSKVNEWSFLRNKIVGANGKLTDTDIHSISVNEVLLSFIKGEDDITLPHLSSEVLEDAIVDKVELLDVCADILHALNSGPKEDYINTLKQNFGTPVNILPDAAQIDSIANNKAYIYFGGVFGLFRAQKESIITDITKLLDRFEEFEFDNLIVENISSTPFSAVDTDPSQQAIINTLGIEANQIIQGPPGTGKSQSLTALVTNALANGLKCLVVCEKKTALDVIKRNIERTSLQMGALVGVIDDVNDDRESIVDSVRDRQNGLALSGQQVQVLYDNLKKALQESANHINAGHQALAQNVYGNRTWPEIVGRYLALQKLFIEVPLKDFLNREDFDFKKDETELEGLLTIIKRGLILWEPCLYIRTYFESLSDHLFTDQTLGESRVIIERFISNALNRLPALETKMSDLLSSGKEWVHSFWAVIPDTIRDEIRPYLPFCLGDTLSEIKMPDLFVHEKQVSDLLSILESLQSKADQIRQEYETELHQHYNTYKNDLEAALSTYLSFSDNSVAEYGKTLLDNSRAAKFKTALLGLVSGKQRRIKQLRVDLRTCIGEVKKVHLERSYIDHQYNDQEETIDLNIYPDNIRALRDKARLWSQQYPNEISVFLSNINEHHFHEELSELKSKVAEVLQQFSSTCRTMALDYNFSADTDVKDINSLIKFIPDGLKKLSGLHSHFRAFRDQVKDRLAAYQNIKSTCEAIENNNGSAKIYNKLFIPGKNLEYLLGLCGATKDNITLLSEVFHEFRAYYDWKRFYLSLNTKQKKIFSILGLKHDKLWPEAFECWYLFWILSLNEPDNLPKDDSGLRQYDQQKESFNTVQLNSIVARWSDRQKETVRDFKSRGNVVNSLFNKKGAKGMRRNSLRTIVRTEFDLFTDFFPVLLVNPSVCSSIIPLEEGIFDLVIFDEASQLRLEDTYAALIRGKAKIVSGDKHQMAPSSYFEGSGALLDPQDEEGDGDGEEENVNLATQVNLADSESLLGYAVDKGFKESYLHVHYRSQHPYLIDFSNHAFYGNRLIPVPAVKEYTPIEYIQVDGLYDAQVNTAEALKVVSLLLQILKEAPSDNLPSIGVATFNIYQRNLILDEIGKTRQQDPAFDSLMAQAGDSFFVKNLENIQGDERDIIIISTTFGRKPNGTFSQNFGPIIQGKGHRMLNVIITRAKSKVYLCTSFPLEYVSQYPQLIQQKGNKGRGILYAYFTYAKAVSDGKDELRNGLLQLLSQYCSDKHVDMAEQGLGSESPFEDEVYARLAHHIGADRVEQQYKVGGFRIDMVIKQKHTGLPLIALECDGAKYHTSPEAYAWDSFRQDKLEGYGFVFYRIWSTKWWDAADRELKLLLNFIREHDSVHSDRKQIGKSS